MSDSVWDHAPSPARRARSPRTGPRPRPGPKPATVADALTWGERGLILVALFLFSEALLGPLLAPDGNDEASVILRLMWLPVYGFTALLALAYAPSVARAGLAAWPVWLAVAVALASASWSIEPDVSLRRAIALAMTTLFGVVLAARLSWRSLAQALGAVFAVIAVMCVIAALAAPGFGVETEIHTGAWKGVFVQKNTMGAYMARGFVVFVAAALLDRTRARLWIAFAVLAALLVLASTSKTSLVGLLTGASIMAYVAVVRRGPVIALTVTLGALVGGGLAAFILVLAPDLVVSIIGRDVTLTGRTDIWEAAGRAFDARPWLGYGYEVFWRDPLGPAYWVRTATDWPVPTAHNGWLETALSLGAVGLAAAVLATAIGLGAALMRIGRGRVVYLALPLMALFIVFSLSESTVLARNSLVHVLFTVLIAKLLAGHRHDEIGDA